MRGNLLFGVALVSVVWIGIAAAGPAERTRCESASGQQQIDACTAVIDDASEPSMVRAAALNNRGFRYLERRALDDAIRDFTTAIIELKLEHPGLYLNRGNAYTEKGDHARAIADYTRVIELKNNDGYANRGAAYVAQGNYKLAIEDFTELLKGTPNHILGLMNRGIAYDKSGRYEESIADFDKAIALKPREANLYFNRGSAHGRAKQYDLALDDFDKVLAINPGDAGAKHNRCRALALKKNEPTDAC